MYPQSVRGKVLTIANENGWNNTPGQLRYFEKPGYEIFMYNDGSWEFTVRDPEDNSEQNVIYEHGPIENPMDIAIFIHFLTYAENIASEYEEE